MTQEPRAHSRFGGSSASRWLNCAASPLLIAQAPAPRESPYAHEGSLAHKLGEMALNEKYRWANIFVNTEISLDGDSRKHLVKMEMVRAVNSYLDAVWSEYDSGVLLAKAQGAAHDQYPLLLVEQGFAFNLPSADPGEVFGTNDALVYHPAAGRLTIFDYKHGQGVSVDAEDNDQLKFYAAGAALANDDWRVRDVELIIVQPRALDAEYAGEVKRWTMDPVELLDFADRLDRAIARAKAIEAKGSWAPDDLKTGAWCKFCPAAGLCPAKEREALDTAQLGFKDVTEITMEALPDPVRLDNARLGAVLAAIDLFAAWGEQVRGLVETKLMAGEAVAGFKLVEKIGRRKWVENTDEIVPYLELAYGLSADDLAPRKLATITEVEKQLKAALDAPTLKAAKDDLTTRFTLKESSGLTVARSDDKRAAVNFAQTAFADVKI